VKVITVVLREGKGVVAPVVVMRNRESSPVPLDSKTLAGFSKGGWISGVKNVAGNANNSFH
jgi:hypothetical protein